MMVNEHGPLLIFGVNLSLRVINVLTLTPLTKLFHTTPRYRS